MKIAFVIGSHRPQSESGRIGQYLAARLQALVAGVSVATIDLGKNPLPFWDEGMWGKASTVANPVDWATVWGPHSKTLAEAAGVVVISPEYAGMVPAALKNLFLLVDKGELAHKPGLIVGVSAARGGAYPVAELRGSSYKNAQLNWIPEHLIVRDAPKMFKDETPTLDDDKYLRARADYALKLLVEYAKALQLVRDSGVPDRKTYPFGM